MVYRAKGGILPIVLSVLGVVIAWIGGSSPAEAARPFRASNIPEIRAYEVQDIALPVTASDSFDISVQLAGQQRTLSLNSRSYRGTEFNVLVQGADGQFRPTTPPPPRTFRGSIDGIYGSRVAASLIDGQLVARVELNENEIWHIEPLETATGQTADASSHIVYRAEDFVPGDWGCGSTTATTISKFQAFSRGADIGTVAAPTMKICDIAFDSDVEYYQSNGSSVANVVADIEDVMNEVALIYENQLSLTFEITTILVRTVEPDPYTSTNNQTLLSQFVTEWNLNRTMIHRDIAHLMTGKDIIGNIVGSSHSGTICDVCGNARGYGFSQSLFTFSLPMRACLTAHELGHNFGAAHCDSDSDCYIMCSVLGACGGSCTQFGTRSLNTIPSSVNSAVCLSTLAPPVNLPFCDAFQGTVDSALWSYNAGVSAVTPPVPAPTPPTAAFLDTCCSGCQNAPDELRSNFVQLATASDATLSYATLQSGSASTAGSRMFVEYWNADGDWIELASLVSDGLPKSAFIHWIHSLPLDAYHDEFRLRFRLGGVTTQAGWFIDDVSISDQSVSGSILFVRNSAVAGGDGSTWQAAFNELQAALTVSACSGGLVAEIWVSEGTYKPTHSASDRNATFTLLNGVALLGGFTGNETARELRDPVQNPTILSGDIGVPFLTSDNSYHVVTTSGIGSSAVLDGFIIREGQANGASPQNTGAGLNNIGGSPTIRNCVFTENTAVNGAASAHTVGASPILEDCTFLSNGATSSGGAMYVASGSTPTMTRCRFLDNTATAAGGAIFNSSSAVQLNSCEFSGNYAPLGGALQNFGSSATLTNTTVAYNTATTGGGIVNNNSTTSLNSCILWGNSDSGGADQSAQVHGLDPFVDYTCLQGWTTSFGGVGNHGLDPLFVDHNGPDNTVGTQDDNISLRSASPCINAGDPTTSFVSAELDLANHPRVLCNRVDMGAYEFGIGDSDCNRVLELEDFATWGGCMTGPDEGPHGATCAPFDFDGDSDIDLVDFAAFESTLTNP
ncbi:MAG: M12 family metallo-peptidase, partial [Planctomycetota bacterium]